MLDRQFRGRVLEVDRLNPAKLLIDPYALAIDGLVDEDAASTLPYHQSTRSRGPSGSDLSYSVMMCLTKSSRKCPLEHGAVGR